MSGPDFIPVVVLKKCELGSKSFCLAADFLAFKANRIVRIVRTSMNTNPNPTWAVASNISKNFFFFFGGGGGGGEGGNVNRPFVIFKCL